MVVNLILKTILGNPTENTTGLAIVNISTFLSLVIGLIVGLGLVLIGTLNKANYLKKRKLSKKSKYWFSSKGFFGGRWPVTKEGWIFTIAYSIIGLIAVFATVPRSENPTDRDYVALIIVGIVLISVYVTVSTLKMRPRPPK